jgi:uncharacterized protein (DUF1697 family)
MKSHDSTGFVALLRGINVGGNRKVSMAKAKIAFEKLGYRDVKTYVNSGNIMFTATSKDEAMLAREIEKCLEKEFAFPIPTLVRSAKTIEKVNKGIPAAWKNDETQRTDVLFLWDEFDKKSTVGLITSDKNVDTLKYISGAIVWNFKRSDYKKSGIHKFIGTTIYKNMSARNVNTVRKLGELMNGR